MAVMKEPVLAHKASLPYCCYDKRSQKIVLRVIAQADVESITLLHGDPYYWEASPTDGWGKARWRFAEEAMRRQYATPDETVFRIAIEVPGYRRLKYGFRVKAAGGGDYYYSENGPEPFSAEAVNFPHNHFFYPFIHGTDTPEVPAWVENTVWYQIFPDRFCKGGPLPGNPAVSPKPVEDWESGVPAPRNFFGGDLRGIRQQLSYLADLGISGIYLTPIFTSSSNHKYNIEDYFTIDMHFGDLPELKALVQEAHARGIKVMLDAVFNHIGENHPYWQDVLKNQEKSRYKDYFHIRRFPVKRGPQNRDDMDFDTFAFTPAMPKWNTENPEARKYLLDAAAYWIRECDIDAWRLDVANEVSFGFWDEFSRLVRSLKKEFYIVGEIWHDASNWIDRGEFDAAMNYPLEYAISNYFIRKTTSADQFTGRLILSLTRYSDTHNRIAFNLLDSHDTDRVLTRAGGDKLAVRNAFTMLFLLPGSPCIYYGTEVGMAGGTDPDNRRPMIWNEAKQDKDLKSFFKTLIALRKKYIALINNSAIRYKLAAGLHCWELADDKSALNIVYSDTGGAKAAYDMNELGQCLFNTEASDRNGELSPYSMAVCYKDI